jgi:hypothetical protein
MDAFIVVGSIEPVTQPMWVFDDKSKKMELRKITYVSATCDAGLLGEVSAWD